MASSVSHKLRVRYLRGHQGGCVQCAIWNVSVKHRAMCQSYKYWCQNMHERKKHGWHYIMWGVHSGEKRTRALGKSQEAEKEQKCKLDSFRSVQQQLCWWLKQLQSLPQWLQLKSLWGTPSLTSPLTHAVFPLGQSPIPLDPFSDTQIREGRVSLSIQTSISKTQRELVLFLYIGNSVDQELSRPIKQYKRPWSFLKTCLSSD